MEIISQDRNIGVKISGNVTLIIISTNLTTSN